MPDQGVGGSLLFRCRAAFDQPTSRRQTSVPACGYRTRRVHSSLPRVGIHARRDRRHSQREPRPMAKRCRRKVNRAARPETTPRRDHPFAHRDPGLRLRDSRSVRIVLAMLTALGVVAATVMVTSYALEHRDRRWIAVFSTACIATSIYAIATGSWLFAILEFIWAAIALRRFQSTGSGSMVDGRASSGG
jgi:hypothetical protein